MSGPVVSCVEMIEICKLIVSAAAKHTGGRHAAKGARDEVATFMKLDKSAVGRLHNAARRARAVLPAEVVAEVEAKAAEDA